MMASEIAEKRKVQGLAHDCDSIVKPPEAPIRLEIGRRGAQRSVVPSQWYFSDFASTIYVLNRRDNSRFC